MCLINIYIYMSPAPQSLLDATREVYRRITAEIRPTPTKGHYLFSTRDISRYLNNII